MSLHNGTYSEFLRKSHKNRERNFLSESEGIVLILLYSSGVQSSGVQSSELKKNILTLNQGDCDEAEEALDSLRSEGYISYSSRVRVWKITEDGKKLVKEIGVIEA